MGRYLTKQSRTWCLKLMWNVLLTGLFKYHLYVYICRHIGCSISRMANFFLHSRKLWRACIKKSEYNWANHVLRSIRLKYCVFWYFICVCMQHINLSVSTLLIFSSVKTVFLRMNNGLARALLHLQWTSWLKQVTVLFQITAASEICFIV